MKIVCVLGSPRKNGNSAYLSEVFMDQAQAGGAEVESFYLNRLSCKGCQACMSCKGKSEKCVVQDDLTPVLDAAMGCDVLVLASPVYYGDVSAQLKGFIDRTFSFLVPEYARKESPSRLAPGKKLVFVMAQGQPDEELFADIIPKYEGFFRWYGFADVIAIRACGVYEKSDAEKRPDLVRLAQDAARRVLEQ